MNKERWTESELVSLPSGEHNFFERKSGAILADSAYRDKLAKAISAFANSAGGHLILGVNDDGTIDGIAEAHGNTPTREWLEQVIPNLVAYPLQDFRVHVVERSSPSTIPTNRIVIVIDIGDSMLAPHQTEKNNVYYHRVGGHSKPAPHHFLEALRARAKYPSQRIAHAWLNYVIAPWLRRFEFDQANLSLGMIDWDRFSNGLRNLRPLANPLPVAEQFLKSYEAIRDARKTYDTGITFLTNQVKDLFRLISDSRILADRYSPVVSTETIKHIRTTYPHLDTTDSLSDDQLIKRLFGTDVIEERFSNLAELVINQTGDLDTSMIISPIWNLFGDNFREIIDYSPIYQEWHIVKKTIHSLSENVSTLIAHLEETRGELASKYGEPYEDPTLRDIRNAV